MADFNSRRKFIAKSLIALPGICLASGNILNTKKEYIKITILHTNDVHSHIMPLKNGINKGCGGFAQRSSIIKKIRKKEKNVLLFDAGDIFQGTPYFNIYKGELELKLMSLLKYDAATIGNHDFDAGIDGLVKQLPLAKFPFISSNYNFSDTEMKDKHLPNKIFQLDGIKIGVFGLGVELNGLVPKKLFGNTEYINPLKIAHKQINLLKKELKCDILICLSHLGYNYKSKKISDLIIAKETSGIDLIIGGHTHTFLNEPTRIKNKSGKITLVNQVGWAGTHLGKVDFYIDYKNQLSYNSSKIRIG